ncbi:capsular exopolysaccharide family protein [Enterococcus durans]|uniref:Tyrosine-protein kinase CpsD n=2 Tax=Enterococcus durans TaxID=53345 RepID=A0A377KMX0_9ENTE|nr:capsular exopolysaccharide family protein [Enterococcus durans]
MIMPVSLISVADQTATIPEQYRAIRSNIQFTSSGPGEGKSTTSANLAVVFANSGKKVLLVDADLRKPSVALTVHLSNINGLTNLLGSKEKDIQECIVETMIDNLWVMTSGPKPPNPSEMLDSKRMMDIIAELKKQYDLIIFDTPPVASVTDAQILSAKTDGVVLVVRERKTIKKDLLKAKKLLAIAKANILGIVYNGVKKSSEYDYYYYHR